MQALHKTRLSSSEVIKCTLSIAYQDGDVKGVSIGGVVCLERPGGKDLTSGLVDEKQHTAIYDRHTQKGRGIYSTNAKLC